MAGASLCAGVSFPRYTLGGGLLCCMLTLCLTFSGDRIAFKVAVLVFIHTDMYEGLIVSPARVPLWPCIVLTAVLGLWGHLSEVFYGVSWWLLMLGIFSFVSWSSGTLFRETLFSSGCGYPAVSAPLVERFQRWTVDVLLSHRESHGWLSIRRQLTGRKHELM